MILRNHGLLTVGESIADAFLFMYILQRACEAQIMALSGGGEMYPVNPMIVQGMQAAAQEVTKNAGGALAWPGILRKLDRLGSPYSS